jgi:hypothetical protein
MLDYNPSCAQAQMDIMEDEMPDCFENGEPKKFDEGEEGATKRQSECLDHFRTMVLGNCDQAEKDTNDDPIDQCMDQQKELLKTANPECFHNGEPKQFEDDLPARDACYEAWTELIKNNCPNSDIPTQNEVMEVIQEEADDTKFTQEQYVSF